MRVFVFILLFFYFCSSRADGSRITMLERIDSLYQERITQCDSMGILIDPPFRLITYFDCLESESPEWGQVLCVDELIQHFFQNPNSEVYNLLYLQCINDYVNTLDKVAAGFERNTQSKDLLFLLLQPYDNHLLELYKRQNNDLFKYRAAMIIADLSNKTIFSDEDLNLITVFLQIDYPTIWHDAYKTEDSKVFLDISERLPKCPFCSNDALSF